MKLRIEMSEDNEDEVVIRCREITPEILKLQQLVSDISNQSGQLVLYKDETEYYLPMSDILFFETEESGVVAHTANDIYKTKYKLYELEELLPRVFVRISKSSIVNSNKIFSLKRNVTASSVIEFSNSHKKIYVSRSYYKVLQERLEEKRLKR